MCKYAQLRFVFGRFRVIFFDPEAKYHDKFSFVSSRTPVGILNKIVSKLR
jgi:hypothetical protein